MAVAPGLVNLHKKVYDAQSVKVSAEYLLKGVAQKLREALDAAISNGATATQVAAAKQLAADLESSVNELVDAVYL